MKRRNVVLLVIAGVLFGLLAMLTLGLSVELTTVVALAVPVTVAWFRLRNTLEANQDELDQEIAARQAQRGEVQKRIKVAKVRR